MKKLTFILFLFSITVSAQEAKENAIASKKNELRFDLLSLVLDNKYSLSYERFIGKDFSIGINGNVSNSKKINEDFDEGYRNNVPKFEINPYVRYNLSKSKSRYYFIELFTSYNSGDYKEIIRLEENNVGYYTTQKKKYTDYGIGGSVGYKMYFGESWGLEMLVGYGKNLSNTKISPDNISRVGINLGYRF